MPDILKPEALSWALSHVRRFGDTDIFPALFEYDAIAHDWNSLSPYLQAIDFGQHKIRPDSRVMVVKPGGGFRAAMQLDPLDHLLYTAAIYEGADLVENARVPVDQKVACSYRIRITPEGAFFAADSGWQDYHAQSRELAETQQYPYILIADVADFYNQLGQHRIQNALEMANVSADRSKNIERFLNQLTSKQSQGLPVGPFGSIILAEACLIDVDNFLLRMGVRHTRYVDDFHVFCTSRKHAIETKHGLAKYLFEVHRLSLESAKSSILYIDKFLAEELNDPAEREKQAKVERLNELLEQHAKDNGPYWYQEVTDEDEVELLSQAEKQSFVSLFAECVTQRPLHLGLARHLLRKALKSRTSSLNDLVFDNLEALAPALRDTVRYLAKTVPKKNAANRGAEVVRFCRERRRFPSVCQDVGA